jgi:hypothetical protein
VIRYNTAYPDGWFSEGGGFYACEASDPLMVNCVIAYNWAMGGDGGGVALAGSGQLVNCTVIGNLADYGGGGLYGATSAARLVNCIVQGNSAPTWPQIEPGIEWPNVTYSCVEGGWPGQGNIVGPCALLGWDPLPGSACIDAGNNVNPPLDVPDLDEDGCVTERVPVDLYWHDRYVDDPNMPDTGYGLPPLIDMGAVEFGSLYPPDPCAPCPFAGDLNCDGQIDFGDINPFVLILSNFELWQQAHPGCPWQNGDINGNGSVGFDDINPFVALLTGN